MRLKKSLSTLILCTVCGVNVLSGPIPVNAMNLSVVQLESETNEANIVYVKGGEGDYELGNGTKANPFHNVRKALDAIRPGQTLYLMGTVEYNYYEEYKGGSKDGRRKPLYINKEITIEGDVNQFGEPASTLELRTCLQLGADVKLKNIHLVLPAETRIETNEKIERSNTIYLAGHSLTIDNVNTRVGVRTEQADERPYISGGTDMLASDQTLLVEGEVTGVTRLNSANVTHQIALLENNTYVQMAASSTGGFTIEGYYRPELVLSREEVDKKANLIVRNPQQDAMYELKQIEFIGGKDKLFVEDGETYVYPVKFTDTNGAAYLPSIYDLENHFEVTLTSEDGKAVDFSFANELVWNEYAEDMNQLLLTFYNGFDEYGTFTLKVKHTGQGIEATKQILFLDEEPTEDETTEPSTPAPCQVTVKATSLKVDTSVTKLYTTGNTKYQLKATTKGPSKVISYKSSNNKVAVVNSKGLITVKGIGNATITVSANGLQKKVQVQVKEQKLSISKTNVTIKRKKTVKLKVTATPVKKITYASKNKKIATVSKSGVIRGIAKGSTDIYVTCNGKTKKVRVQVV